MKKTLSAFFLTLLLAPILFFPITTLAVTEDPGVPITVQQNIPLITTLESELKIKKPVLEINIPKLDFSNAAQNVDEEGYIHLPWIGEYIAAIYKFAMVVASILAVIVLIVSGARMMVSAGGEEKNAATKRIGQALVGLFICWGSYAILYNINPALVEFQALKIKYVEPIDLENYVVDNYEPTSGTFILPPKPLSNTTYDTLFQDFSTCINADWRILKVMAYKESGLNTNIVNKYGFKGLFQTKTAFCAGTLKKYPAWSSKCSRLSNPSVNTAVGAKMLENSLNIINAQNKCPNATLRDKLILIYLGHNSGAGAIQYTMDPANGGCDEVKIRAGIIKFWDNYQKKKYAGQKKGEDRFEYAKTVADLMISQGITNVKGTGSNSQCPLKNDPPNTAPNKYFALGDSITASGCSYADKIDADKVALQNMQTSWMYNQIKVLNLKGYKYLTILGGVNDIASGTNLETTKNNLKSIYKKAHADGLKVVAITLNPWRYPSWTPTKHQLTLDLNTWIRNKGENNIDIVVDFYNLATDGQNPSAMKQEFWGTNAKDHLHPNCTAHQALANEILRLTE